MTDTDYLVAGLAVFVAAAAAQLGLYRWLLRTPLQAADAQRLPAAFRRWLAAAFALQLLVVAVAGYYVFVLMRDHPAGVAWIAPPLALLLGTALPLQLVAATALRAGSRAPR